MTNPPGRVAVVVPTAGRRSLQTLLDALAASSGPPPDAVVIVDDRRPATARRTPLPVQVPAPLAHRTRILAGRAAGPAAARNTGWRATDTDWVAFVDDDVVPGPTWLADLAADLAALSDRVAGSQGRLSVPLPTTRRPTDWERNTAGLASARWITADMCYRRRVLAELGGFDERFPRAFREDSDLALRAYDAGYLLLPGARRARHPVRPASRWASLRVQAGNADDVLMRRLHGRGWHARAGAGRGRLPRHVATTAAGVAGLGLLATGRRRPAAAAMLGTVAGTAELTAARIKPGPRSRDEVATMVLTSAAMPPVATYHWLAGLWRHRRVQPQRTRPAAVLFDRDGTLIEDVPYNGDPALVRPMRTARAALDRLRAAGIPVGVISNQSGVARGLLTNEQVEAVNARVEALLGPFDVWQVCPHGPGEGCECRKPAPGMVMAAATALGVRAARCVIVGDVGADVAAARAAGAQAVLVPTERTRPEEVRAAPQVAADLHQAVELLLESRPR